MGTSSRIVKILKASAVLSVSAIALLFSNTDDDEALDERPLHDADLTGELNYRTGKLDAGLDPYGWYDD